MARAVAISVLASRIRWGSDSPGTARLTDADLYVEINASWQALRELCADGGHKIYLKAAPGTLTPGAATNAAFGSLSVPADFVRCYGLEIVYQGRRRSLQPGEWQMRNEYSGPFGNTTGVPSEFHVYNIGTESTTAVTPGTIAIYPAPDQAYPYTLWYLPNWVDIDVANPTYVFNGVAGWDDWVVQDGICKIAGRDNDMANTYAIAKAAKAEAEARILRGANSVQRAGPTQRVDTAALAIRNRADAFLRRP